MNTRYDILWARLVGRLEPWQKWVLGYAIWFVLTEVVLVQWLQQGRAPDWLALVWIYLHPAVNPVLACVVVVICLAQVPRLWRTRRVLVIMITVPILLGIAYLGLTFNDQWMRFLGVNMLSQAAAAQSYPRSDEFEFAEYSSRQHAAP